MLTLWGRSSSANVQKVAWLLGELDLEVDRKDVGGPFGGLDTAEYTAMNPNQLIPTLQDGAITIWESEAVLRYLGTQYGEAFFPTEIKKRALVDQWMCWMQSTWFPSVSQAFLMIMKVPVADRNPNDLKRVVDDANAKAAFMDGQLEQRPFVAGDVLSLADFSFAAWLYRYFTLEIERPDLKNLENYYDLLCSRRPYVEHVHISYEFMRVTGAERP